MAVLWQLMSQSASSVACQRENAVMNDLGSEDHSRSIVWNLNVRRPRGKLRINELLHARPHLFRKCQARWKQTFLASLSSRRRRKCNRSSRDSDAKSW